MLNRRSSNNSGRLMDFNVSFSIPVVDLKASQSGKLLCYQLTTHVMQGYRQRNPTLLGPADATAVSLALTSKPLIYLMERAPRGLANPKLIPSMLHSYSASCF